MVTRGINYPSRLFKLKLKTLQIKITTIMKKVIIIPEELQKVLKTIKHKKRRNSLIAVYEAFLYKYNEASKKDEVEYFEIPYNYLKSIRSNYQIYRDLLIDNNIIQYKSVNNGYRYIDIFEDEKYPKKYYNTKTGNCMSYKFLIDINQGREIEIEIDNEIYNNKSWYKITKKSLEEIGLPLNIKRDSFGRRLHTPVTSSTQVEGFESYWTYFSALKGYSCIDINSCIPTFLYQFLKDKIEIDEIFHPDTIYDVINPEDRDKAKKDFATWLNCEVDKMPRNINEKFPKVSGFIKEYKNQYGYKSLGKKLQLKETSIMIDDMLSNIEKELNIDFCLTIHDSFIIKNEDADRVYNWCVGRYKELKWKKEKI